MNIRALIFDVDGTLADTEEAHRLSFNDAFAAQGLPWRWNQDEYAALLKTTGGKERIGIYVDALAADDAQRAELRLRIPEIHRLKTAFYTERVRTGGLGLRPGVRRLFAEAIQHKVRLAIATTTTRTSVEALLATVDPQRPRWFDVIAAGDDVVHKKPAPDVYEFALQRLGLPAAACVAFEDSANGLRAAKAAGLFTVVTPSYWTRNEDFADADLVLETLGDPERPLTHADAAKVGNSMLGLTELSRLFRRSFPLQERAD